MSETPELHSGEIIPAFILPGADGMPHSPWDYKQRENLVLILLTDATGTEAQAILQDFQRRYAELREEYCAVLVVTANTVIENLHVQDDLRLPFALLADPTGQVMRRYTVWDTTTRTATPAFILANRYGALRERWIGELPALDELLVDLRYMNTLCTP